MTEHETTVVEVALRDLGAHLAVPDPAPVDELTEAVRARLAGSPGRARGFLPGGPVLLRVAAVLVVAMLAFAVLVAVSPPVRAGVLNLLRYAGIEFGTDSAPLPADLPTAAPLPGERAVDLATARQLAGFEVSVPEALGAPQRVLVADGDPPRVVSLVYRDGRVRLDQFDGTMDIGFFKKLVGTNGLDWAQVNGATGVWVDRPHEVVYVDRNGAYHTETARLSGATLIWPADGVTLRLEGEFSLAEALEIAKSVR